MFPTAAERDAMHPDNPPNLAQSERYGAKPWPYIGEPIPPPFAAYGFIPSRNQPFPPSPVATPLALYEDFNSCTVISEASGSIFEDGASEVLQSITEDEENNSQGTPEAANTSKAASMSSTDSERTLEDVDPDTVAIDFVNVSQGSTENTNQVTAASTSLDVSPAALIDTVNGLSHTDNKRTGFRSRFHKIFDGKKSKLMAKNVHKKPDSTLAGSNLPIHGTIVGNASLDNSVTQMIASNTPLPQSHLRTPTFPQGQLPAPPAVRDTSYSSLGAAVQAAGDRRSRDFS
ncbi:uncharacterized protein AB675_11963 [Cyphellophora attinorum]|uniref:Uncharacterized protein n=1 Tax=Cyphellophora attinorum TaxID=1664694 RepID=A0A0N1H1U6_9EURO|nr:uncharacterized protein AB675_11963 [Phialophora attinorum]KPI38435.1 hypothetical protein AB675_11963 [Phialophora attinorum]